MEFEGEDVQVMRGYPGVKNMFDIYDVNADYRRYIIRLFYRSHNIILPTTSPVTI